MKKKTTQKLIEANSKMFEPSFIDCSLKELQFVEDILNKNCKKRKQKSISNRHILTSLYNIPELNQVLKDVIILDCEDFEELSFGKTEFEVFNSEVEDTSIIIFDDSDYAYALGS